MRRRAALAIGLAVPAGAPAHPVDEIVQGAYLEFEPTAVRLELDVSPGPAVAATILRDLDPDGDRRVSAAEARAYARRVLAGLRLTIDGAPCPWRLDQVGVPPYANVAGQADTIRVFAWCPRREGARAHLLAFDNGYRPAASVVTTNIFPRNADGWRYRVTDQQRSGEGRRYRARIVASR